MHAFIDYANGVGVKRHFAGTICTIRRAAPAIVLAEKSVVRAEGLEPSWTV
jgi:hypothetical protein